MFTQPIDTRHSTNDNRQSDNPIATNHSFPVKRVSSVMRQLGHPYIDMLKLDTEGGEFEDILGLSEEGVLDRVGCVRCSCSQAASAARPPAAR
eukprot:SAG22_NODE_7214_length_761_cov_1.092145_2_plen_93_part_00